MNVHSSSVYNGPPKKWIQSQCPSTAEWINKMWYVQTVEYYLAIKRIKYWIPGYNVNEPWNIMLTERSSHKRPHIIWFLRDLIYLFLERGGGREKERERNINAQNKHWLVASHTPPTGDLAATQVCVLIGNRTSNVSVFRSVLNPLSHTSQGCMIPFIWNVQNR